MEKELGLSKLPGSRKIKKNHLEMLVSALWVISCSFLDWVDGKSFKKNYFGDVPEGISLTLAAKMPVSSISTALHSHTIEVRLKQDTLVLSGVVLIQNQLPMRL